MKKYRMSIVSVLLFVVVLVFAYLWHLFTKQDIPFQMLSALLGAAITVIITNLLLNSQTESEFANQKKTKIYEEKLRIYQEYIKLLCNIVKDKVINDDDYTKLQYQLSLVALHTTDEHYQEIVNQTEELLSKGCPVEKTEESCITNNMMNIVRCFQNELYGDGNTKKKNQTKSEVRGFDSIVAAAKQYKEKGGIGIHPSDSVADKTTWKEYMKRWEKMGWKKDEGNAEKDYLRFNLEKMGYERDNKGRSRGKVYVDILFELTYGHYIIRAKGTPHSAVMFQNQYGGFKAGDTWWKVLESPFYEFGKMTLEETFDSTPELKDKVACWFDNLIKTIMDSRSKGDTVEQN